MIRNVFLVSCVALMASVGYSFEYNVRRPSDDICPTGPSAVAEPGVWTLNFEGALEAAKANGRKLVVLNSGSFWCPYCETLEEMVLTSSAWKSYVNENGFYLAVLDFPYRGTVTEDQEWKSVHPELGAGWGFSCWLMDAAYLAGEGMSTADGLAVIMHEYEIQKSLALPSAGQIRIRDYTDSYDFVYGKVGYPTLLVFGEDGAEIGRMSFPWASKSAVTASEAQEYVLQTMESILVGKCAVCEDPVRGVPLDYYAQRYTGWLTAEDGGIAGTFMFKTGRRNSRNQVKVSGWIMRDGKKTRFPSVKAGGFNSAITLEGKNGATVSVKFGSTGLSGHVVLGGVRYLLNGGRDVFRGKDADSKARAAKCPTGTWSVVLKPADKESPSPFARGYGALSVQLRAKGKARIKGWLGDGTSIGVSSQAIVGENGMTCLPVLIAKRKGNTIGFVIWFKNGRLFSIDTVSKWQSTGAWNFTAACTPSSTMSAGIGIVEKKLDLEIDGLESILYEGLPPFGDPSLDEVTVEGKKWHGTEVSRLKLTLKPRNGLLNGSMRIDFEKSDGHLKRIKGAVHGVVMGGSGYGMLVIRGVGTWPVKIMACGSCGTM